MKLFSKTFLTIGGISLGAIAIVYVLQFQKDQSKKLPYYVVNPTTNEVYQTNVPSLKVGTFSFINQEGKTITQNDLKGHVYVADYFFVTCPGICKTMSNQLERVYAEFENTHDVKILSHTAKPDEDSVEALMNYAMMHQVKKHDHWLFVTGDKKELYSVARKQYHIVNDQGNGDEDDFIHTEQFALIDKNSFIRGYYDGTDSADVTQLIQDIHTLLKE
jgi:protein SCO1/2